MKMTPEERGLLKIKVIFFKNEDTSYSDVAKMAGCSKSFARKLYLEYLKESNEDDIEIKKLIAKSELIQNKRSLIAFASKYLLGLTIAIAMAVGLAFAYWK